MKLGNLFWPALLLVSTEIWTRVAIQGIEQGLLSAAVESSMRWIKIGRMKLSRQT